MMGSISLPMQCCKSESFTWSAKKCWILNVQNEYEYSKKAVDDKIFMAECLWFLSASTLQQHHLQQIMEYHGGNKIPRWTRVAVHSVSLSSATVKAALILHIFWRWD